MSQQGVTCIRNGVISEYTPLQEWDHHRRQAQLLSSQSMLPQSSMNKYNRTCLHPVTQAAAQAAHPADAIAQCCRCKWPEMQHDSGGYVMCRCFDRLQNISFFRDFIRRRALTRWRKVDVNLRRFSCPAGHPSDIYCEQH